MKYKCTACGYIYDDNVEAVKFEDLPDDWVCPLCGLGKEFFEKNRRIRNDNIFHFYHNHFYVTNLTQKA